MVLLRTRRPPGRVRVTFSWSDSIVSIVRLYSPLLCLGQYSGTKGPLVQGENGETSEPIHSFIKRDKQVLPSLIREQ